MSALTNNKFQTENFQLKKDLEDALKLVEEKEMRNNLLRITIEKLQTDARNVVAYENEKNELLKRISELEAIEPQVVTREIHIEVPVEKIVQSDEFEKKYLELKKNNKDLLDLYDAKCSEVKLSSMDSKSKDTLILSLQNSIDNLTSQIEEMSLERDNLKKIANREIALTPRQVSSNSRPSMGTPTRRGV